MNFSVDKTLTFDQAVELMFRKLGDWKIMALASSVNDYVMVRNVSCLFYDGKVWFKTDKNFRKTQQLYQNPQVALCWSGVQIEGTAKNCGLVIDEPDRKFEKLYKEHLWGRALKNNGLTRKNLSITPQGLTDLILLYTREAGVRELERKIGELCRKVAKLIVKGEKTTVRVTEKNLEQFLGKPKFRPDEKNDKDEIGIVRGLAWTAVGGDTLQIEVNVMPGKGVVELTGRLGEVMKESAAAGISYIRSVASDYKINPDFFKKKDIHIHIPEGAVPKDGPSAGITMATAVLSAIAEIPVYANLAMTGEITLRGRVLPIGGVKEKILAAKMAGITKVIVPKENERDVLRLEAEITDGMEVVYAETMDDVLKTAFTKSIEKGKKTGENKKR